MTSKWKDSEMTQQNQNPNQNQNDQQQQGNKPGQQGQRHDQAVKQTLHKRQGLGHGGTLG